MRRQKMWSCDQRVAVAIQFPKLVVPGLISKRSGVGVAITQREFKKNQGGNHEETAYIDAVALLIRFRTYD